MFKKNQLKANIEDLDVKIKKLTEEYEAVTEEDEKETIMRKLEDLVSLRCKLSDSKDRGSLKPAIVSGAFGIASLLVVLKYEETDVITSKAFNMATSMFRGSK